MPGEDVWKDAGRGEAGEEPVPVEAAEDNGAAAKSNAAKQGVKRARQQVQQQISSGQQQDGKARASGRQPAQKKAAAINIGKGGGTPQKQAARSGKAAAGNSTEQPSAALGRSPAKQRKGTQPEPVTGAATAAALERSAANAQILATLGGSSRRFGSEAATPLATPAAVQVPLQPQPAAEQLKLKPKPRKGRKAAAAGPQQRSNGEAQPATKTKAMEEMHSAAEETAPGTALASPEGAAEGNDAATPAAGSEHEPAAELAGQAPGAETAQKLCVLLNPNNPRYDPAFALEYAQVRCVGESCRLLGILGRLRCLFTFASLHATD
jgi:hypothetical protein